MKPNTRLRNIRALITKHGRIPVNRGEIVIFRHNMQCFVCIPASNNPNTVKCDDAPKGEAFAFEVTDVIHPVYQA